MFIKLHQVVPTMMKKDGSYHEVIELSIDVNTIDYLREDDFKVALIGDVIKQRVTSLYCPRVQTTPIWVAETVDEVTYLINEAKSHMARDYRTIAFTKPETLK